MNYSVTENECLTKSEEARMSSQPNSIVKIMRALHRDIGFFLIGITLVYCLSGIVLIYRNTDFLKTTRTTETVLESGLSNREVRDALNVRRFRTRGVNADIIQFDGGEYNKITGAATVTQSSYPSFIEKLNRFHSEASGSLASVISTIYGILLLFLAVSAFWMYKPKTSRRKRGIYISLIGGVLTLALILI